MEPETSKLILISLGVILVAFLALLVGINTAISRRRIAEEENKLAQLQKQKQVELFKVTVEAEDGQKARIAANLHDQVLAMLALRIKTMRSLIQEPLPEQVKQERFNAELSELANLSSDIREIAHDLMPKAFSTLGFIKSVWLYASGMNESAEGEVVFLNNTKFDTDLPISKEGQLHLYRVCLEILNNIERHTEFEYLEVALDADEKQIIFIFSHDGKGVSNKEIEQFTNSSNGIGLKSMQSRLLLLNAVIDYSNEDEVSHVKLIVPIK